MKTKLFTSIFLLAICMLATLTAMAQQPENAKPSNSLLQVPGNEMVNYTYKVFQAPNKMFGYDIFRNEKIVFHYGASTAQPNNLIAAIAKKTQAEKAALLTIEKIKKHEEPALTQNEIKKL